MKLIDSGLKTVNYFGIELQVPKSVTHICTQSDGKLWIYESLLGEDLYIYDTEKLSYWHKGDCNDLFIEWCEVDLEDQDWTTTLREV